MIERIAKPTLTFLANQFRAIAVVGPRQSGKTTLVKSVFPQKPYVFLENPDVRLLAKSDPRGFLMEYENGAIIDEVQRVPELFNYLQEILDNATEDGMFILTGSNNFLIQENISQTLAGRVGILDLFPFSFREINSIKEHPKKFETLILSGGYPEIYDRKREPSVWYQNYIRTYVERDVRQLLQITNSSSFTRFLKLCAGRVGQQLNISALSNLAGIKVDTAKSWLSVLQQSFVIYLLQPYHQNFNKRLTKSPKLYFYDSGLACNLLGIKNTNELKLSHFFGGLAENYVISDIIKNNHHLGLQNSFYYWRESNGLEIDLLIEDGSDLSAIEIKAGKTIKDEFFSNLMKFKKIASVKKSYILYDGTQKMNWKNEVEIMNWRVFDFPTK